MFEIGPVHITGGRAFGFTTRTMDDGHGGKVSCRLIDLGNEVGRRDLETGLFRLDPLKTSGLRFGRPSGLGDSLKAW